MNHSSNERRHSNRRIGRVAAAGTALTATALVAIFGVAGAAYAGDDDDDDPWTPGNLDDFTLSTNTIGTIPPGMTMPLPDDDDPPIYVGPSIPVFFDPSAPDDTPAPDDTLAPDDTTAPDDTAPPVDTAAPDTTAPTDPPAPTTTSAPTTGPAPTPETPASAPAGDAAPFLVITTASVDCAAVLHVTFETGALPELAPDAEHVVMYSPASNPTAVTAQRLIQRPQNGVFTLDIQSPLAEQYRVIVTADFEPANLEGGLLVDEADAAAPSDCPVPTPSG